ncbi:hypothetical protein N5D45_06675 [Stenotrophomonas sp. GD03819]|uniref:HNH endonuclease n=1 Tax=Stenotrophomonas sp. GD03819 TaxID=2975384 RepID=UPI00244C438A|nr:hypothetical protein [Stenotrophomonas sp. GD03819]MDH1791503.1 hypothetical protein [Stenotrophomonas sp. GD03819]
MTNPLDELVSSILSHSKRARINVPRYQKPVILDKFGGVCAYCGTVLNATKKNGWGVTHAVPVHLGGESSADNRIPSCISCIQRYGAVDCLAALRDNGSTLSPTWANKLNGIRDAAALRSRNHLTHLSPKSDISLIRNNVLARWPNERFTAFLTVLPTSVIVGMNNRCGSAERIGSIAAMLRFGFKANHLATSGAHKAAADRIGLNLFVVDRSLLLTLTMALIEENGWLQEIKHSSSPNHLDSKVWRSFWPRSYVTIELNRKRRVYGEIQAPWAHRVLSSNPGAVRARRHYQKKQDERLKDLQYEANMVDLRAAAGQPVDWAARLDNVEAMLRLQLK